MDLALMQVFQPELDRGERVLWAGRPNGLALGWRRSGLQMLFMIPWTGFAIFWTLMATGITGVGGGAVALVFPLFGLMFVGVGSVMFIRAALRFLAAGRTVYAVTDKRVIILDAGGRISSYGPSELGTLTRTGTGARGTVSFQREVVDTMRRVNGFGTGEVRALVGIENPRDVERLIRERLLNGAR